MKQMNGQHLGLIIMFGLTSKAERFVSAFDNVKKTIMFCRVKCKRYLVRNGCPICECNPFVYDQPYCCPKEHDGCCPARLADRVRRSDPNILFACFSKCYSDDNCKIDEKYCGNCSLRCMKAVIH
ncbi:unnamed protein product [Rotaria sp. Silwood1]|nr:unnamed protein product [Rotaria sp. Silwood1]